MKSCKSRACPRESETEREREREREIGSVMERGRERRREPWAAPVGTRAVLNPALYI